jgi:integrase
MSRVYSTINFAISRGWTDRNPFFGIRVKLDKTRRREKKRLPFSEEEHQKIIDEVLEYPNLAGEYQRPSMFWVPLLCMFSGCRRNEACQLYRDDVVEVDGIKCINIDNDRPDKRLKNEPSRRTTPIHSMLIKFGFLDYVDKFKPGERLFPELRYFRDGYGHSFKRFQPQLRKLVTTDERKVMHSFRHMISGQLMQKGQHSVWRADLLGHSRGEVETDATYTELTEIQTLKRMLELVEYPGINFDKCYIKHYRLAPRYENDEGGLPVFISPEVHNLLLTLDNYSNRAQWLTYECRDEMKDGCTEATFIPDSLDHHVSVREDTGRIYVNLCEGDGTDEDSEEDDNYEIEF